MTLKCKRATLSVLGSWMLLCGLLTANVVQAASIAGTAVAGDSVLSSEIDTILSRILSEDSRYELVDRGRVLGDEKFTSAREGEKKATALIQKAREAYEILDLSKTLQHVAGALQRYEKHSAYLSDYRAVARALTLVGAVFSLQGQQKKANARIRQALAIYPAIEPDPKFFNPQMRQAFDDVVLQVEMSDTGSIMVASNEEGAEVYVNGVHKGWAPVTVDGLRPGPQHVRVQKPGFYRSGKVVRVKGGETSSYNGVLEILPGASNLGRDAGGAVKAAGTMTQPVLPKKVRDFASKLGAEQLFVVNTEKNRIIVGQYDIRTEHLAKAAVFIDPGPYGRGTAFRQFFSEHFGSDTLFLDTAKGTASLGGGRSSGCAGWVCGKKRLGWLIGGLAGGALVAGAGAAMYGLASSNLSTYIESPQVDSEAKTNTLGNRDSAKTFALVGDILVPLGAAVMVSGVLIYALAKPKSNVAVGSASIRSAKSTIQLEGVAVVPRADGGADLGLGFRF